MPEAHWKLESIEARRPHRRHHAGIQPDGLPRRLLDSAAAETDGANFRAAKIIFDENLQDIDYIKEFTDLPLLIRTDTLQYLDPRDVIADYKFPDFSKSYSGRIQSLKPEQIERLGGMMVWDSAKGQTVPLHREQVGFHFKASRIDPALTSSPSREIAQWPGKST